MAGDRLNFGLAAEQAKAEGHSVDLLVVGDDCSLPGNGPKARRGLAGTIMVYKVCSWACLGLARSAGRLHACLAVDTMVIVHQLKRCEFMIAACLPMA